MVRKGFTLIEIVVAGAVVVVLMGITAHMASWALQEKHRAVNRQAALELADNFLELARATAWDELTPEWAAQQRLPEDVLADAKLAIRVDVEKSRPTLKRVTVNLAWSGDGQPRPTVELVGFFARPTEGSKP